MSKSRVTRIGLVIGAGLLLCGCASTANVASPIDSARRAPTSPIATGPSPIGTAAPSRRPSLTIEASPAPVLASTTEVTTEQPAGSTVLEMTGPPPRFVPSELSARAGDVVFFLKNTSPARDEHAKHALAIGPDRDHPVAVSDLLDGLRSAVFTVRDLQAGTYAIWCPFPGHADLGQVGTLTITH